LTESPYAISPSWLYRFAACLPCTDAGYAERQSHGGASGCQSATESFLPAIHIHLIFY